MSPMKNVLIAIRQHTSQFESYMLGIRRLAKFSRWQLTIVQSKDTAATPTPPSGKWDGAIIYNGNGNVPFRLGHVPKVYISSRPPRSSAPQVRSDSAAIGRLAARELRKLSLKYFAYLPWHLPAEWSRIRGDAFAAEIKTPGVLLPSPQYMTAANEGLRNGGVHAAAIAKWLDQLPRPCGIFAANDRIAEVLLNVCATSKIAVPDEVSVVGVDNHVSLCEYTTPSLTSVAPDFERTGFAAAQVLSRLMNGHESAVTDVTIPPIGIVHRASTDHQPSLDHRVRKAREFIRLNACMYIGVDDVAKAMGCSRTLADVLFRSELDHTVLEEITEARFARLFELLKSTDIPISQLPAMLGYRSENYLKRLFKAHTGLTMREWRKNHCGQSHHSIIQPLNHPTI